MKIEDIINREFNELLEVSKCTDCYAKKPLPLGWKKALKDIAQMTDDNDHTQAIITGLHLMGNDSVIRGLIKKMEKLEVEHNKLGYLPTPNERNAVGKKLQSIAKKRLGDKYDEFHGAF